MLHHHFYSILNKNPAYKVQQDKGKQIQDTQICKVTINGKLYDVFHMEI